MDASAQGGALAPSSVSSVKRNDVTAASIIQVTLYYHTYFIGNTTDENLESSIISSTSEPLQ